VDSARAWASAMRASRWRSEGVEVLDFVGDVLDLEGVEDEAEFFEVVFGFFEQGFGEGDLVFVDLFGGEAGQDASEVAL
jgi:hypothetical protein